LNLLHDLRELVRANFSLYFIVDNDYGRLAACTHTAAFFKRDISIGRGLTHVNVQHLFGFFNDLGDASDIAGRAQTKLDRMFATRLLLEE
jgi:hypothetical protein